MVEQRRVRGELLAWVLLSAGGCTTDVVEHDSARFRAIVVSSEFAVDPMIVHQPTAGRWPAVAFDGTRYLVVWEDQRARRPILYGGRLAADGTGLDPLGFPILDAVPGTLDYQEYRPAVATDGDDFLVVTRVAQTIRAVRVSAAGEVLDPGGIVIATTADRGAWPSLVFDGQDYRVAWAEGTWPPSSDNGVYSARVRPDGTVLDPEGLLVATLEGPWTSVGLSFDGTNHLLSWTNYDNETNLTALEARRVAADGTWIDEIPIRINPIDEDVRSLLGPVAGFDGSNHVIAWTGKDEGAFNQAPFRSWASRVTPDGVLLDPEGIGLTLNDGVSSRLERIEMAAGGGRSVVVGSAETGCGLDPHITTHIGINQIAADGTVSEHPANEVAEGSEAALAVHPDGGLLMWREGFDPTTDLLALTGTRLDAAGVPVADGLVAPASPASRQELRAVASDGEIFFVVWVDRRGPDNWREGLFGARLAADGTPLDSEPVQLTGWDAGRVAVAFDGANFVVAWTPCSDCEATLQMMRVSPAGAQIDPKPVALSSMNAALMTPSVASDGTHTLVVGWRNSIEDEFAAALVDRDLELVGVTPILSGAQGLVHDPELSFDGVGYLVVWHHGGQIFGQRINAAGGLEGERTSIVDWGSIQGLAIVAGAGDHLLVWHDHDELWAGRVSPSGELLDPDGILVATSDHGFGQWWDEDCTSVAFDGASFFVSWRRLAVAGDWSSLDTYAAKLSVAGEVLSEFPISTEPQAEGLALLAGRPGRVLAAYTRFVPGPPYDTRRARGRVIVTQPAPELDVHAPVDGCSIVASPRTPAAPLLVFGLLGVWLGGPSRRRR